MFAGVNTSQCLEEIIAKDGKRSSPEFGELPDSTFFILFRGETIPESCS